MNEPKLILNSILHYRRSWMGVLIGTALTSMILTGALLIGDSAKTTLRNIALQRLGKTELAMTPNNQFFKAELAARINDQADADTAAILKLRGIALTQTGRKSRQVNNVQVLGVNSNFWQFAEDCELPADTVAINQKLARELDLKVGAEISLRIEKPSIFPRDAPLSSRMEDLTERRLFIVDAVVPDENLGRFSLENSQRTPANIFIDRANLQSLAGLDGKANILLLKEVPESAALDAEKANAVLATVYQPEDFGIGFNKQPDLDILQLKSESVYIPKPVSNAVDGHKMLTYLVNTFRSSTNMVPYSFVAAMSPAQDSRFGPVPPDMADDEVLVNSWLAKELAVAQGDNIQVTYYNLMSSNEFTERTDSFRVYGIVGMDEIQRERKLTPEFPGLTDIESCADWAIGMPMDQELLEDPANEAYWNEYRETPKAFFTFQTGQKLWGNRFGDTTAIRMSADNAGETRSAIRSGVDPVELGYFFIPVREQALQSVEQAIDLGQLFLGMSFFLMASSLLITAFLFGLTIQQRANQSGLMLAMGFRPGQIQKLFLSEGGIVAVAGSICGCILSFYYTKLLLQGIAGQWQGAVANAAIQFHYSATSLCIGGTATVAMALVVMFLVMRKQLQLPAPRQLRGDLADFRSTVSSRGAKFSLLTGALLSLAAVGIVVRAIISAQISHATESFFAAGALLLIGLILFVRWQINRSHQTKLPFKTASLVANNIKRRKNHSLGIVALLACGCFLVFAVSAMKENLTVGSSKRSSGTGGFDFYAQSTIPLLYDLGSPQGREEYRIATTNLKNVVNIKLREGDDSSCFNLNKAMSPTLLGVDPERLSSLHAFESLSTDQSIWQLLNLDLPDNTIPAIVGDSDTLMWGLQKEAGVKDGDVLVYRNEFGQELNVKLVAALPMRLSIFQGRILIAKDDFARNFPSESGRRVFLLELVRNADNSAVRNRLAGRLERYGFEITPAIERLQAFYAIESAYLSIFLVLGGLGLILGAAGMGAIVWRNIAERRHEIEILHAVGFPVRAIRRLLVFEYATLLIIGMVCGILSASIAILPNMLLPGSNIPWGQQAAIALGIAITGTLFTVISIVVATKRIDWVQSKEPFVYL